MGGFVIPLVPGTFLLEQSPVLGSWLQPCCQGLKQRRPTVSHELAGLARPDLATWALLSTPAYHTLCGVLPDTLCWGGQLHTTARAGGHRPIYLSSRGPSTSEQPHEVEPAPRQPGQERAGRPCWWDGGSVLPFPSLELRDRRAIFTTRALGPALLINCICPCCRWGQSWGWGWLLLPSSLP